MKDDTNKNQELGKGIEALIRNSSSSKEDVVSRPEVVSQEGSGAPPAKGGLRATRRTRAEDAVDRPGHARHGGVS